MNKVIITAALTGAQQGKAANPNLPEQPEEIIAQAVECARAGAGIVHLHARDQAGKATAEVKLFRQLVEGIRAQCDVILNLTTGGAIAGLPLEERIAVVPELKPEIASFSVGSAMVGRYDHEARRWSWDFTMALSYAELEFIARAMLENGTRPELEIYDLGMINNALLLRELGLLTDPLYFNFVMGIPGQVIAATAKNLLHLVESIPAGAEWVVTGIGRHEFPLAAMAMAMGGHARVGLEDNVYLTKGVLAGSNAQLVEKVVRLARDIGREPATPDKARTILNLGSRR